MLQVLQSQSPKKQSAVKEAAPPPKGLNELKKALWSVCLGRFFGLSKPIVASAKCIVALTKL